MTEDEMVGWDYRVNGHGLSELQVLVMDREACVMQSIVSQGVRQD